MFGFNVNFGGGFEVFDCMVEVEVDGNRQTQRLQAPQIMIKQQFLGVCQEIAQINKPAKVRLSRIAQCYDDWNDEWNEREVYISFVNNYYDEENKK